MTGLHPRILLLALTAAALVVPTGARAQSDLQTILDDWAKALGGRERLAAPAVIEQHVTGKMFGLDGDARTWSTVDGRMRLEFDLGGGLYHFVQVLDGHQGWQVDQNGKLSPLEAHDLEAAISSAYADRNVQLLDPSRGTIELLEPAKEGPRVRCVPEGGEPITYTLDPTTHLPLRYETPAEERVQVTTILGWAERHGVQFPSAWDQSRGDPQYDAHLELQDVVFHDAVDPAWFAKPTEGAGDVFFTDGSTVKDIPIELNTVHVFVQCSVNGSPPLWFVLDTGASITVINRDTAEALGMDLQGNLEGRGAGEKTTDVHLVGDVTYGVPGVELRGQTIAAVDLGPVEAMMGRELDGILGFDFISRFVVEIDYAGLRMDLHDRNGWTYTGSGTSVPVTFEGNLPHVQAEMVMKGRDPVSGPFLVDTGANAAVYASKPFSEQHDLVSALDASFEFDGGFGVGGRSKAIVGRIPELRIAGLSFQQPVAAFSLDEKGAHADPNVAGLIGGLVLQRCRIFFDYEHKQMILEPGPGMEKPFTMDSLGLVSTTDGRADFHHFTVVDTVDGSPAAKAGLQEGDEILVFDGTPAAELTVQSMWQRVQQCKDRITLRIRRDGKESDVDVQLRPLI